MIEDYVSKNWNVGRGKRTLYKAQDVLFMTHTVLKHGQQWNFTARLFSVKCSTFERLITGFLRMLSEYMYDICVARVEEKWTMAKCRLEDRAFSNSEYGRYAVDVNFQQSNRPSGSVSEGKRYFSGKHNLYGYKVEASVLLTGLAIGCTENYPGSVSDLEIFRRNRPFHEEASKRGARDLRYTDGGRLSEFMDDYWAILADKGYQGAAEDLRVVGPVRTPAHAKLSLEDVDFNREVFSDRVIIEN